MMVTRSRHAMMLASAMYCKSSRPIGWTMWRPDVPMLIVVQDEQTIAHRHVNMPCLAFRIVAKASLWLMGWFNTSYKYKLLRFMMNIVKDKNSWNTECECEHWTNIFWICESKGQEPRVREDVKMVWPVLVFGVLFKVNNIKGCSSPTRSTNHGSSDAFSSPKFHKVIWLQGKGLLIFKSNSISRH